tara:strand:- start:191 stop:589 length:399 start_codon:yes stop_codon:yes gene_type:complete
LLAAHKREGPGEAIAIVATVHFGGERQLLDVVEAVDFLPLSLASAGNSRAARMAMMAMTTSNSISVKARRCFMDCGKANSRCREVNRYRLPPQFRRRPHPAGLGVVNLLRRSTFLMSTFWESAEQFGHRPPG